MQRAARDSFTALTSPDLTSGNACLETPPAIFQKLTQDFGPFDVDLTADAQRHLCEVWFGPGSPWKTDALVGSWGKQDSPDLFGQFDYTLKNGYSNPPYGRFTAKMLKKAKEEAAKGFTSTLLIPLRVTKAFKAHVVRGATSILFCDQRIIFYENGKPKLTKMKDGSWEETTALFDSIIVRYLPGLRFSPPRIGIWSMPSS